MGDLNLDDYEAGQGISWFQSFGQTYYGNDFYALMGWQGYLGGSFGQVVDILDYCEIATSYNNNPCDYPLIINDQGIIDIDSITAAWEEVNEMVSEGEISITLATQLFPDVNNNGFFDSNDQNLALTTDVILGQENAAFTVNNTLICEQEYGCPYTGNPCDYPMLLAENSASDTLIGSITGESMSQAARTIFDQIQSGELSAINATCYWPDFNNDEYISTVDLLYILPSLLDGPIDCPIGGEPPPGGPVKPSKVDPVKPAFVAKVAERRKKNKEDKEDKENY